MEYIPSKKILVKLKMRLRNLIILIKKYLKKDLKQKLNLIESI